MKFVSYFSITKLILFCCLGSLYIRCSKRGQIAYFIVFNFGWNMLIRKSLLVEYARNVRLEALGMKLPFREK